MGYIIKSSKKLLKFAYSTYRKDKQDNLKNASLK